MDKHELEAMTKDELVEYADNMDVEVDQKWLKDDIIKEILKGQKAANKPDSIKHNEGRIAKIEHENKTAAEDKEIANFKGLPKEGETRDQLLDRIRAMREEKEAPPETEPFRSEAQLKEFQLEQEAGRAAVAKAEEIKKKYEESLAAAAEAAGEKNPTG